MTLVNTTAIITGGNTGIGFGIARKHFAAQKGRELFSAITSASMDSGP